MTKRPVPKSRRRRRTTVASLLAPMTLSALLALPAGEAHALTFTVTSTADTNTPGTLRFAIAQANANPGSTIAFSLPASSTITLTSSLPTITAGVTIDGTGVTGLTISGANSFQVFTVNDANASFPLVSVQNLTVTNSAGNSVTAGTLQGTTSTIQGNVADSTQLAFNQATTGTYGGVISGVGSVSVTGGGTVTFSQANTYSGGTTITNGGVLSISSDANLGATTGGLTINNSSVLITTATFTSNRSVTISGGQGIISPSSGTTLTLGGTIGGIGQLLVGGGGTVVLTGTNTYGSTVIDGTLSISSDANLGASTGQLIIQNGTLAVTGNLNSARSIFLNTPGGTISFLANVGTTLSGTIGGAGALTVTSIGGLGGILTLSGTNTYTGGTIVNGSSTFLAITSDANLGASTGGLTLNNSNLETNATLTSARSVTLTGNPFIAPETGTTLTLSGTIGGTGELIFGGGGTLVLSGTNTYSGGTSIGSTLSISSDANLGASTGGLTIFGGATLATTATLSSARNVLINSGATIDVAAGTTTTLSGVVSGTGPLTKVDTGTLVLSGTNTYTGGTAVNGGTLSISSNANLGATTGGLTLNGGTLATTASLTSGRAITLGASGGTVSFLNSGTTTTLSGPIGGTGPLTVSGPVNFNSTLVLSGTNTYSGGTIVNGFSTALSISSDANLGATSGGLTLNNTGLLTTATFTSNRALTLNGGQELIAPAVGTTLTLSGPVGGNGQLLVGNGGTLVLSGNNTYGSTVISGGTLSISSDANLGASTGPLNFQQNGTLAVTASLTSARSISLIGGGTISFPNNVALVLSGPIGGTGPLTVTSPNAVGGILVLSGTNTYTGGTIVNGSSTALYISSDANLGATSGSLALNNSLLVETATLTSNRTVTLTGNPFIEPSVGTTTTLSGPIGGTGSLVETGGGTLVLSGTNTYSGGTSVLSGVLSISSDANLGASSGSLEIGSNGALATVATTATLTGARGVQLNGAATIDVAAGTTTTLSGAVSGGGSLTKADAGTLVLSGNNSYTGGTVFTGGTLSINSDANLGTASGGLTFNGGTLATTTSITSARSITLGASGGTISLLANGSTTTLSGTIGGTGALTVTSNNNVTLVLSGMNTYSGGTTVNGGSTVLSISSDANLGAASGGLTFNNSNLIETATLTSNRTVTLTGNVFFEPVAVLTTTLSGPIGGSGALTADGGGTLVLSGTNTYSGGTYLISGRLSISSDANLGASTGTLALNGGTLATTASLTSARTIYLDTPSTIDVAPGTTTTLSGAISGGGSLTKVDAGTLVLTGTNSYTGGTTVSGGTLQGTTSGLQGSINDITLVAFNQATAGTFNGTITGPGAVTVAGGGTVTFANPNSYTGGTTVLAGGSLAGTSSTLLGSIVDNGTVTLNVTGSATTGSTSQPFGLNLTGDGILNKGGSGTLTIVGSTTFGGTIGVTSGSLNVADGSSLEADGGVNVAGRLQLNGPGAVVTGGTLTVASGGTVTGTGTITNNLSRRLGRGGLPQCEQRPDLHRLDQHQRGHHQPGGRHAGVRQRPDQFRYHHRPGRPLHGRVRPGDGRPG